MANRPQDIRVEAAKAAEKRAKMMQCECGGREVSYSLSDYSDGYVLGHSAGYAEGARAALKWQFDRRIPRLVEDCAGEWRAETLDEFYAQFLASAPATGTNEGKGGGA
jgi:hypothetical protein